MDHNICSNTELLRTSFTRLKITDEEIKNFDRIKRGLDWGYAQDPFAYIVMHYDKTRKRLYIFKEIYQTRLSNSKAAEKIKQLDPNSKTIIADSAEPKSIKDLKDLGLKARGAKKGPDSVDYGIKFLSEEIEEIIIDSDRCPNAAREFLGYETEKDKDGNFKGEYPDKNNHTIDAARYAMEDEIRQNRIKSKKLDLGI
jgi:phage terminase large subunit